MAKLSFGLDFNAPSTHASEEFGKDRYNLCLELLDLSSAMTVLLEPTFAKTKAIKLGDLAPAATPKIVTPAIKAATK